MYIYIYIYAKIYRIRVLSLCYDISHPGVWLLLRYFVSGRLAYTKISGMGGVTITGGGTNNQTDPTFCCVTPLGAGGVRSRGGGEFETGPSVRSSSNAIESSNLARFRVLPPCPSLRPNMVWQRPY